MAEVKKVVSKPKPLTEDEKAQICEEYLGIHPKFFLYGGQTIRADIYAMEAKGVLWRGWRIHEMQEGEWLGK